VSANEKVEILALVADSGLPHIRVLAKLGLPPEHLLPLAGHTGRRKTRKTGTMAQT